jgi:protein SCO1
MTRVKWIAAALWGLVALALCAVLWFGFAAPRLRTTVADTLGQGDYRLVATDGSEFTEDTLKGNPSAVFFGFTHCPEVCPTTLGDIAAWQDALGGDGARLRAFFVTVDPERDTQELLDGYVSWVPGVTGVTGTAEEVEKAVKAFRIYARKVPLDGGDYTMDHSALVLLFDEDGRFVEPIGYREDPDMALGKLRNLVSG